MKKLYSALLGGALSLLTSAVALGQTFHPAAYYWAKVPAFPTDGRRLTFQKFLDACDDLSREIDEEAQRQQAALDHHLQAGASKLGAAPTSYDPATAKQMIQRAQSQQQFLADQQVRTQQLEQELNDVTARFDQQVTSRIPPLEAKLDKACPGNESTEAEQARKRPGCQAALAELAAARQDLRQQWYLAGQTPFKGHLTNYRAWLKSSEPQVVQQWTDSFIGSGMSVKGQPCAETVKMVGYYVARLRLLYARANERELLTD